MVIFIIIVNIKTVKAKKKAEVKIGYTKQK